MVFVTITMQFVLTVAHRDRDAILAAEAASAEKQSEAIITEGLSTGKAVASEND